MYPLHFNYITTLPCRTITMKITILYHQCLYWNQTKIWKFDISDYHSLLTVQNHAKQFIWWIKTCLKCPLPAFTQTWSLLTKLSMALLMEFCGRSSHIICKAFFSSSMVFGLGWSWRLSIVPQTWYSRWLKSGEYGGHSSFPMKLLQLVAIQFWASFAVWAGAPPSF